MDLGMASGVDASSSASTELERRCCRHDHLDVRTARGPVPAGFGLRHAQERPFAERESFVALSQELDGRGLLVAWEARVLL
jgi:hypothetical protein